MKMYAQLAYFKYQYLVKITVAHNVGIITTKNAFNNGLNKKILVASVVKKLKNIQAKLKVK
jgi:hypothetical protein